MPERSDLFAFVLALVRDPLLAAQAMRGLPPGFETPRAAREAAVAVCRRRKRPLALDSAAIDALEKALAAPSGLRAEALRKSLDRVGRQDRSLLIMRYRQGMGLVQIARRVKNTVTKTQKALHRARMALEQALRSEGPS